MFKELEKKLLDYIFNEDEAKIDEIIKEGANIKERDGEFKSILMLAFEHNVGINIIKKIILYGANINAKDGENRTVLMYALKNNASYSAIKLLVDRGANIKAKDIDGNSIFMYATRHNDLEVLKYFIEICQINTAYKNEWGRSLITYATQYNENIEVIDFLVTTYGLDINEKGPDLVSTLMLAARDNNNPLIIKSLILKYKLDVNDKDEFGKTPLMYAAMKNSNPEVIKMLLNLGADIDTYDKFGKTAVQFAAERNPNPEIIKILVEYGAKINEPVVTGDSFTDCLIEDELPLLLASMNNNALVVDMLINCGADIRTLSTWNENLLMGAVKYNKNMDVIDLLLGKYGIDVNYQNVRGETALMLALESHGCVCMINGQVDLKINEKRSIIFDKLMDKGANIYAVDNQKKTVLMHAVCGSENPIQIIESLISQYNLDINAKDCYGTTPLMFAAELNYNLEIFHTLIANGAKVDVKDNNGHSILWYAQKNPRKKEVIKLLKKYGAK